MNVYFFKIDSVFLSQWWKYNYNADHNFKSNPLQKFLFAINISSSTESIINSNMKE